MKPFEMPVVEWKEFSVEDVITVSYGNETPLLPFSLEEEQKIDAY